MQVTWEDPTDRHHKALDSFYERYPQAEEPLWVTAATYESVLARLWS